MRYIFPATHNVALVGLPPEGTHVGRVEGFPGESVAMKVEIRNRRGLVDPKAEKGKAAILSHVKDVMRNFSIELEEFIFHWDEDPENARWTLVLNRGRNKRQLSFREHDVEAWEEDTLIADKYRAAVLSVVDLFTSKA